MWIRKKWIRRKTARYNRGRNEMRETREGRGGIEEWIERTGEEVEDEEDEEVGRSWKRKGEGRGGKRREEGRGGKRKRSRKELEGKRRREGWE